MPKAKKGKFLSKKAPVIPQENIYNIPNALCLLRIILMPVFVMLIVFTDKKYAVIFFVIAAITDALDGYVARHFDQKTKFGALFDPLSDRIFMIPVVIAAAVKLSLWVLLFVLVREAIASLGILYALIVRKSVFVPVKQIGKATTVLQSFAVPAIIIGVPYAEILVILTAIVGVFAGATYIRDVLSSS